MRHAAGQAGDAFKQAGSKFTTEVAPSLADLFRSAAAGLSDAASKMETRASATDVPVAEQDSESSAEPEAAPSPNEDAAQD